MNMVKYGNDNYEVELPDGTILASNVPIQPEMEKGAAEVIENAKKAGAKVKVIKPTEREKD